MPWLLIRLECARVCAAAGQFRTRVDVTRRRQPAERGLGEGSKPARVRPSR
eukprot:COSAG04_NODE_715_length_10861_cov_4.115406_2_plen_51_part_00